MSQPETRVHLDIAPEVEVGVYANFVSIWHDRDGFTLDFAAVTRQPQPAQDPDDGTPRLDVAARVVSRVRIPPSQVFEIMKALEQQLTAFELQTGSRPPGETELS